MEYKNFIQKLGFTPKESTSGVFSKKYTGGYIIELDFEKKSINYGDKIKSESKTTQNFSQAENGVILECVNRILEKGYKPENIILEKTWASGHGTSGRLDICVTRDDGSEYLLIECKTSGKEFDKEFARMKNDGGQLFTYFKFSNKADVIMLYSSELNTDGIVFRNEIIKIEDDYRSGDVKDFYDKWNKLTKDNGIFNDWTTPYCFISKALTPCLLEPIKQEDSGFIFNRFLEILRHNVVSDKPNAFNKIFTLFLCKIYDEKTTPENEELKFQWLEGVDDDVSFQMRLTDLYKNGMYEFLEKKVTDFSTSDFENKYKNLDEKIKEELLKDIIKLRLEKNNEFAIKEVFDTKSFKENAKVVKQVVELLQGFKIRYNKKQQYLSDFFELLLTTGLKQESGQFFTPVPIAQFIIKSIPIDELIDEKLKKGERNNLLPYVMDYAAGSGHFLTETMHEVQRILDKKDPSKYISDTAKKIKNWQEDHFDWALQYVYGVEKDYRLVKVGKVGCYLHGDGLANVIHSDGLGNFKETEEFKDQLAITDTDFPKENKQFDIVVSNPPYSVQAFKQNARNYYTEKDFDLYSKLTDNSSEIECLFIERTKQLLKDGGMAGVILPSSILSNTGIYTKAREIILKNFDIIAITELGSNTFMATGTNTVTLFLRRRNNYDSINLKKSVEKFFTNLHDVTQSGIEKPVSKYVDYAWDGISFEDYKTLLQKQPNETIAQHEIFKEYQKKVKSKNEQEKLNEIIKIEKEKIFYFILVYPQKVVLVKSGQKLAEKQFLGYEFSNRRGSEGIHPIQRGKSIDECTKLFDANVFDNPEKASTYIYKAFKGDFDFPVSESLQKNISRANLVDMLNFDRIDFEKNISLLAKKKIKIESRWELKKIGDVAILNPSKTEVSTLDNETKISFIEMASVNESGTIDKKVNRTLGDLKKGSYRNFIENDILIAKITPCMENGKCGIATNLTNGIGLGSSEFHVIRVENTLIPKYLFELLNRKEVRAVAETHMTGASGHRRVPEEFYYNLKIPLPPINIQEKIVSEIEVLEQNEKKVVERVEELNELITKIISSIPETKKENLCNVATIIAGQSPESTYYNKIKKGLPFFQGKLDFSDVYLSSAKVWTTKTTKEAIKGDILMSVRAPVGDVNLNPFEKICIGRGLCAIRTNGKILQHFLWTYLKSIKEEIIQSGNQGATFKAITKTQIETLKIPIQPLSKQQKIVSKIEKIENQITKFKEEINTIPKQKEMVLKKYLE